MTVTDSRRIRSAKWAGISPVGIHAAEGSTMAHTWVHTTGGSKKGEEETGRHQNAAAVKEATG